MGDMGKGRGQPLSERPTSRHYCCCFPLLRSIKRYDGYEGEVAWLLDYLDRGITRHIQRRPAISREGKSAIPKRGVVSSWVWHLNFNLNLSTPTLSLFSTWRMLLLKALPEFALVPGDRRHRPACGKYLPRFDKVICLPRRVSTLESPLLSWPPCNGL